MNNLLVKVKKLNDKAILPEYGSEFSAGADLHALLDSPVTIKPKQTVFVGTGLSFEIPEGFVGLVYARSGLSCKKGIAPANKVGVIDSDYRGEITVALYNQSNEDRIIEPNDRIAQFVLTPYFKGDFVEADSLDVSTRGEGGFGSTGK